MSAIAFEDLLVFVKTLLLVVDVLPVGFGSLGLRSFTLLLSFGQPLGDFVSDGVLSIGERLWLTLLRGVEVNAVSTCVTLNVGNSHSLLGRVGVAELAHGRILPWVLATVQEEDVVTLDIEATIEPVGVVSLGLDLSSEDALAVVGPEVVTKAL